MNHSISLDMAGNLPVSFTPTKDKMRIVCDVSLLHHAQYVMVQGLRVVVEGEAYRWEYNTPSRQLICEVPPAPPLSHYRITLHGRVLLEISYTEKGELMHHAAPWQRLTVMELRMIAQSSNHALPYERIALHDYANPDYWHSRTDLHTHLTSQIYAKDLLEIAATQGAAFPCELLALLGIDITDLPTVTIPSTPFSPAASDGLHCEQAGQRVEAVPLTTLREHPTLWRVLQEAMEVGVEEIIPFDTLERRIYRMRNPLTKHPALIAATIERIAKDYQQHGVNYAELAVTAALDPDWLAAALPALTRAKDDTGVTLKLLIGLPRTLPPAQILQQLQMVMFVAQHPHIVGVDFLGYEANKTSNFAWALAHFARFARGQRRGEDMLGISWQFADDLIMRVHAGENGKNPDNVEEVLNVALKYDVRVRVGHATYGDAAACITKALLLAQHQRIIMEFNPDSNIAMNNIDKAEDLPVVQWAKAGIPYVLASDGAGVYQTDARQLFNAGIFAGLGEKELTLMMETEAAHIAYQQALGEAKAQAFYAHYANDDAFIAMMRDYREGVRAQTIETVLQGKIPLLIAGASGSSWRRIDSAGQADIIKGISELVATLDATRIAFVVGRIKPEGIGKVLDEALEAHYAAHPDAPRFTVIGMLSGQQNMPSIASHINHIVPLHGELMRVPVQMTQLLKTHHGMALYMGGSAFTRDFILCSKQEQIPFTVMAGVAGASGEKAHLLPQEHVFHGATGMVAWIKEMVG